MEAAISSDMVSGNQISEDSMVDLEYFTRDSNCQIDAATPPAPQLSQKIPSAVAPQLSFFEGFSDLIFWGCFQTLTRCIWFLLM